MALARALKESTGDEIGRDGLRAVEVFYVQKDSVTQNTFQVLAGALQGDIWGRSGVALGQAHPDPAFGGVVKASSFRIDERISGTQLKVTVLYRSDVEATGGQDGGDFDGWLVSSRFNVSVAQVGRSLPELNGRGQPINSGRLFGAHVYIPAVRDFTGPPEPDAKRATHKVIDPVSGEDIYLHGVGWRNAGGPINRFSTWQENAPIRPEKLDRLEVTTRYTFTRTLQKFSLSASRDIDSFGGHVNFKPWSGFPSRTLLFIDFTQSEQINETGGFEYPVTVHMEFKKGGWTPIELIETYRPEGADAEAEVIVDGAIPPFDLERPRFEVYPQANFDDLFSLLETGELPEQPALPAPSPRRTLPLP